MALLDLSLVTKTLIEVVKRAIAVSPAKPAGTINVTALPPDRLEEIDNALGIYLYHFVEEGTLKNTVWPKRPGSPNRNSPVALNLHYVLSAHSSTSDNEGPFREQLLMGLATKALHDFPIINDETKVGGVNVMPTTMIGDDNRINIALRHVPANEAVSFWTAGSKALRLSSYYEVAVVMLEPEQPTKATGRVLTYGVETFVGGLPRLEGSRSSIEVTIPGTPPRMVEVQPAQVAIGDSFTLHGTALGTGILDVRVRGPGVPEPTLVGVAWGASAFGDEITATVQPTIGMTPSVPGTYAASIQMTRTTTLANGTTHETVVVSNETPFQVVPAVTAISVPTPAGNFTVTGGVFKAPAIPGVRVSLGGAELAEWQSGTFERGQFKVNSASEIEIRLVDGLSAGQYVPVRIVINGGESQPQWVQVP